VPVRIEGRLNILMAEMLLDGFGVGTSCDQNGGARVAKIVEAKAMLLTWQNVGQIGRTTIGARPSDLWPDDRLAPSTSPRRHCRAKVAPVEIVMTDWVALNTGENEGFRSAVYELQMLLQ